MQILQVDAPFDFHVIDKIIDIQNAQTDVNMSEIFDYILKRVRHIVATMTTVFFFCFWYVKSCVILSVILAYQKQFFLVLNGVD